MEPDELSNGGLGRLFCTGALKLPRNSPVSPSMNSETGNPRSADPMRLPISQSQRSFYQRGEPKYGGALAATPIITRF